MMGPELYPGVWECGHCHAITHETHFFEDRTTGTMQHEADSTRRQERAERCGRRYSYNGYAVPPVRCALSHGHWGNHDPKIHGHGRFGEDWDAIPPVAHVDGTNV